MSLNPDPSLSLAANGNFALRFYHKDLRYHVIEIPNSEKGLMCIRNILMARQREETKIGQTGNPTQEMVRAWLSNKNEQDALTLRQEEEEREEKVLSFF